MTSEPNRFKTPTRMPGKSLLCAGKETSFKFKLKRRHLALIDKLVNQFEDEYLEICESLKSGMQLRFRDLLSETVNEFSRMQNFCRIFPARNSKLYDKFFSGQKPLNKIMYKVFYTSELLPYERSNVEKSAHPVPSKASALLAQNAMSAQKQG